MDGAGSTWIDSSTLTIGEYGTGMLNIQNGGTVSSGNLTIGEYGTGMLNIQNGGTVSTKGGILGRQQFGGTGTATVDGAGSKWTNSGGLTVGSSGTGRLSVQNGGTVSVGGTLDVGTQGKIQLAGGDITATQLQLAAGSTLSGHGSVSANIVGGTATTLIQAAGGALNLGNLNSTAGFNYGGKLDVGSNQVTLNDKDQAQLGVSTTLADGGRLQTVDGALLSIGKTLNYTGNARIGGAFTNNGLVSATGAGTLAFQNAVNGAGGFGGDIHFQAAYSPGNSPAIIDFHGGNATFDATSLLDLEVLGAQPGTGYDQLIGINRLNFNGALDLLFGHSFTPVTGETFNLFDFNQFSGQFDPARITVIGFDRARLDFSALPLTGELRVIDPAPVPEPGTVWLFLLGLGAVLVGRRIVA